MKTIAVLGANGRLGRVVAKSFLDKGYHVIAVTRTGRLVKELAGAEGRAADAMKRDEIIRATAGADIIFNGLNPLYTDWKEKCMPMAENVVAAAKTHGATHLFPGNVYSFGAPLVRDMKESTPFTPSTRKGRIRVQMEGLFEKAAREDGIQTIILRAGDFFGGAGTGSWFDMVIAQKADKGVVTWPGPANLIHAWAYLPDLAATFVELAEKRLDIGRFETFHFPGHTLTGNEMAGAIAQASGRQQKVRGMPWWAIRAGGLVVPMWREIAEMNYLWQAPHRLVSERLEGVIGPVPHTPLNKAVAQALADIGIATTSDEVRGSGTASASGAQFAA
jgi:nucleoside-diphosphate-sugar epimerase